jgi:hypothetical protein
MIRIGFFIPLLFAAQFTWAFPVSISTTVEGGDKPTVVGKTNLPDSMELMVTLIRRDNSYIAQRKVVVSTGRFRAGPFSQKGAPLEPGGYQIEVSSPIASLQPQSVRAVIGEDGEKQDGPLTKKSILGQGKVLEYETTIRIGTARAALDSDRARNQATLDATKQLADIIRHGRSMQRLRRDDLNAASECGKQMRIWQPKAKALDQTLDYGKLKAAASEAISCVSCLPSAKSYCDRAEEIMKSR